jgi:hypothetical protein
LVLLADVDGEALRYVQMLGAELVWKVRGMGTTVACLRAGEQGPAILLSGHLQGPGAILVYRVQDYAATVTSGIVDTRGRPPFGLPWPGGSP